MGMVTGYCIYCFGSGTQRTRNQIGTITLRYCERCKGTGTRFMSLNSGEHRISKNITFRGDSPGIRKHNNDRGWNRR